MANPSEKRPSLSVVVITRNEAANLPRLLDAVSGWTDEVVVYDSGSTDGTPEIARAAGARVVDCPWQGWSATKNAANAEAVGDWILSLDADEAPDGQCARAIVDHMAGGIRNSSGAWRVGEINRLTRYCGRWVRHSGWFPDRKVRLWPRGAAHWEGAIHEWPVFEGPAEVHRLQGLVEHHSYPRRSDHLAQIERFGQVWAEDRSARGESTPMPLVLAKVVAQWTKTFLLRRGFLDGRTGWTIARLSAWATWRKHARLRLLRRGGPPPIGRILISRTDALGDLVLSLPITAALRRQYPMARIDLLVRPYAHAVAESARDVDTVVTWSDEAAGNPRGEGRRLIAEGAYDAIVFAFPDRNVVRAARAAGIPLRLGTGRRWHTALSLTHRNWDGRRDSGGHEAWHGMRLLLPVGIDPLPAYREMVLLKAPEMDAVVEAALRSTGEGAVLLHPGSHGSAGHWPMERFAELATAIALAGRSVAFTGTEAEGAAFAPHLPGHDGIHDLFGRFDLRQLLAFQSRCGAVIASSTGPLHTATALGRPGIGLYGDAAPEWPERWAPIGPSVRVLSTGARTAEGALDIPVVEVLEVLAELSPWPVRA